LYTFPGKEDPPGHPPVPIPRVAALSGPGQPQGRRNHRIRKETRSPGGVDVDPLSTGARRNGPMKGRRKETIVGGILVGLMAVGIAFF